MGVGILRHTARLVDGIKDGHGDVGNRQLSGLSDRPGNGYALRAEFGYVDGDLGIFKIAFQTTCQDVLQLVYGFALRLDFADQRIGDVTAFVHPCATADLVGLRVALLYGRIEVGVRPDHDVQYVAFADVVAVGGFAALKHTVVL